MSHGHAVTLRMIFNRERLMSDMSEVAAVDSVARQEPQVLPSEAFVFTGSGGEYFRIWAVNWLLIIVTLGIYSPWAKVRRLKYFHQNTRIAGYGFDYHASPLAILKGRGAVLAIVAIVSLFPQALGGFLVLGLFMFPVIIVAAIKFRLRNTSYRGVRFGFSGTIADAYYVFFFGMFLSMLSFGLLAPFFHSKLKEYVHGNSRYGMTRFGFLASVANFYGVYVRSLILLAVTVAILSFLLGGLVDALAGGLSARLGELAPAVNGATTLIILNLVFIFVVIPFAVARIANLSWGATKLGQHGFQCSMKAREFIWIYVTNALLVIFTLGIFAPWAAVDIARYRASAMRLRPGSSLDDFFAAPQLGAAAFGQEASEWFDMDIGL